MQGYCQHEGQVIFSDGLHYILKGSKLIRCCLDQINAYRSQAQGLSEGLRKNYLSKHQYLIDVTNLPKSFGFLFETNGM